MRRGASESSTLSAAPSSWPPFMWDAAVRAEDASAYSSEAFPLF